MSLVFTPFASMAFRLTRAAVVGLPIMRGVFRAVTQPVNRSRLKDQELRGVGAAFFATGAGDDSRPRTNPEDAK